MVAIRGHTGRNAAARAGHRHLMAFFATTQSVGCQRLAWVKGNPIYWMEMPILAGPRAPRLIPTAAGQNQAHQQRIRPDDQQLPVVCCQLHFAIRWECSVGLDEFRGAVRDSVEANINGF